MTEQSISEKLIHSIQLAKDYVESNLSKKEKDEKVNYFFDCATEFADTYGDDGFKKVLLGIGFSDYEMKKIIDLKNQSHLTDLGVLFFKEIDVDLNVAGYVSPLSKNKNWLSAAIVDKGQLSNQYGKLIEYISKNPYSCLVEMMFLSRDTF